MPYGTTRDGSLVYWVDSRQPEYQFIWLAADGTVTPISDGERFTTGSGGNIGWRLDPEGRRIAFRRSVDGNEDIWIKELPDGPRSRLTLGGEPNMVPTWTADGRSVNWRAGPVGRGRAYVQAADGSGQPELVFDEFDVAKAIWSPDREWLVVRRAGIVGSESARDIYGVRPGIDSAAIPLIAHPQFWEQSPAISHDGQWLA